MALSLLLVLPLAAGAQAVQQEPPAEQVIQNDQVIQALKDEVVEFAREAQAIEDEVLYPPHSRLSVYLAVKVSGLLLNQITLGIDDQPVQTVAYSDRDARALLSEGNLQRLLRVNIAPGPHRVRVTFSGKFYDDKPDQPPLTDSYEAIFDKGLNEAELEFLIARPSRFSRPALAMKQWRASK
ncbi:MAG TPA: hypothetical protein VM074_12330 [Solimonas sp.]|nr:hypothetical protein [Solimonas sp.]